MRTPWTQWRQRPVIVVPGITATTLQDEYPIALQDLWTTVLTKEFERLAMHPSDPCYETDEPAMVRPGWLLGLVYTSGQHFGSALRVRLELLRYCLWRLALISE